MSQPTAGLHHVTAISGAPHENLAFYTERLGQRLVKQTVNFDDPGTWHLYYGDAGGSPGTILTFFPFPNAAPGREGPGQALAFAYGVPRGAFDGWVTRLGAGARDVTQRFGARVLSLRDPHGQRLELIEADGRGDALGGFHSVTLWVDDPAATARVLTDILGYAQVGEEAEGKGRRMRFAAPGGAVGRVVDILRHPGASGRQGAGTIHHIAFRAADDAHQDEIRARVAAAGHHVTPRIDRQYFNAIYFREPGGTLFEVATDPPGFAVDEAPDALGTALKLPPRYEAQRDRIAAALPPLRMPEGAR
ncbi:ring-cleaving dioxygenase [Rhodobaculum claviforme]|uniref:Glyoxalase n=1 Tax=Rhodobaculum claviforme TaxID=1549854 RepID=A0A934TKK3_9RHOB|nr:ring-cleaving dioxygenase [Rhodobaculum claviforme]MBK5927146.1 glyoxalase [Rhodobaculum claviforme]